MQPILNSVKRQGGGALVVRGILAVVGGYACAALSAMAIARWLPMSRVDASLTATMASFLVYALAAIWAFAARTVARAARGLALTLLVTGLLAWLPTTGIWR